LPGRIIAREGLHGVDPTLGEGYYHWGKSHCNRNALGTTVLAPDSPPPLDAFKGRSKERL
jgi:hypothetical protein